MKLTASIKGAFPVIMRALCLAGLGALAYVLLARTINADQRRAGDCPKVPGCSACPYKEACGAK